MTTQELDAWQEYLVGKPCPKHPHTIIKNGKFGLWCGNKTELRTWCDGGFPTKEFLESLRKETI